MSEPIIDLEGAEIAEQEIRETDVAIVGMSGRFPGAAGIDELWQALVAGRECISRLSDEELLESGVEPDLLANPRYVRAAGVLDGVAELDAAFFSFTPAEAALIDPQHRLFLEHAWSAIEDAAIDPERFDGLIGVYAGAGMNTYLHNNLAGDRELMRAGGGYHVMVASDKDFLATRVAYKLNLKGPALTVQTACSTSLVAVHLACQALRAGECDAALAGGVSIRVPTRAGYLYQEGVVLSPDGVCRAFDADASGTVIGSGVGVVVLKLLPDAIADGDRILAVIRGSALNNDGSLKAGYTAPGLDAQAAVIREAQGIAEVEPETVTYVEAHGTGTPIGDPIEIAALTRAFRSGATTDQTGYCAVGSIKTNIGHLDAAAGVAGLIKAVLAVERGVIPASLNLATPNPRLELDGSPFYINTETRPWLSNGLPRRAGISSFGIGGTNAHVIIEQAPAPPPAGPSRPWSLLPLSARSAAALEQASSALAEHLGRLAEDPDASEHSLGDVAHTLQRGRKTFEHRRIVVARDLEDARAVLSGEDPRRLLGSVSEATDRPVAFMLSGQGSQHVGMGRRLYETEPAFAEEIDRCSRLLEPLLGLDLVRVLFPEPDDAEAEERAARQLAPTAVTQPALFVLEHALARLWMSWGLQPQALIGHSIGELVAVCLAGVMSIEDALRVVAERGRLMQEMPPGAMLAVPMASAELQPLLGPHLDLGAINGAADCVVSGPAERVDALARTLETRGVTTRRLHTSHAFHSAMMDPAVTAFARFMEGVSLHPPQIPCISNLSGTWLTAQEATDPGYWARHLRQTVRFADGVRCLLDDPDRILLEVGPGRMLATLAGRHPQRVREQVILPSLPHPQDPQDDDAFVLEALGRMWLAGARVDLRRLSAGASRRVVPLPTYAFQRQRCWIDPVAGAVGPGRPASRREGRHESRRPDMADWFYVPSWQRSAALPVEASLPAGGLAGSRWLVLADACGLGAVLAERLRRLGADVVEAHAGETFAASGDATFTVDLGRADDIEALIGALLEREWAPTSVVHMLGVGTAADGGVTADDPAGLLARLDRDVDAGLNSLLLLLQALGQRKLTSTLRLDVVTTGLDEVRGDEVVCPTRALALGPIAIAPHEYPGLQCRGIDLEALGDPGDRPRLEDLAEKLIGELVRGLDAAGGERAHSLVALRGRHRWVREHEQVRLGAADGPPPWLVPQGAYLVTGGLGGIGLAIARHLAATASARLVLLDRRSLPSEAGWDRWLEEHGAAPSGPVDSIDPADPVDPVSRAILAVRELRALGAEVLVMPADICDRHQVGQVLDKAIARLGRLDGVIHAAGLPGGGMMQVRSAEDVRRVLAPKVRGTLVLAEALANALSRQEAGDTGAPVGFMVLCSSVNTVAGRIGQADYCAANAFLDSFARCAGRASTTSGGWGATLPRVVSIAWETWREVGMAVDAAAGVPAGAGAPAAATVTAGQRQRHPLLGTCLLETEHQLVFVQTFDVAGTWVLSEHGIMGRPTVPGTSYLEMARAACEHRLGDGPVELDEVQFLEPMVLGDAEHRQVRTVLESEPPAGGDGPTRHRFTISSAPASGLLTGVPGGVPGGVPAGVPGSAGEGWTVHARGTAIRLDESGSPVEDLDHLRASCDREEVADPLLRTTLGSFTLERRTIPRGRPAGGAPLNVDSVIIAPEDKDPGAPRMELGPRWQILDSVRLGERRGLAHLVLDERFSDDLEVLGLHPAILDFATSYLRIFFSGGSYLPLAYRRLRIYHRLPGRVWSYSRFAGADSAGSQTLRFDVTLLDDDGRVLVDIEGFAVMRIDDASRLDAFTAAAAPAAGAAGPAAGAAAERTVPGGAAGGPGAGRALVLEDLEEGLSTAEGLEVLDRVLRSRLEHVVVSTRDLGWRIEAGLAQSELLLGGAAAGAEADRPRHPRPELMNAFAAPRSDVEQRLAEIWQDVLGFEKVGVHDNFFELGGDSLLITRVHTRFAESFDAEMSVADLLQYPTIADLARRLEEDGGQHEIAYEAVQERAKGQKDALKRRKEKMKKKARAAGAMASGAGSGRSARASRPGPRSP